MGAKEVGARLEEAGLGKFAPALLAGLREGYRLVPGPVTGASRLGGDPDLPEDVEWPTHRGVPLSFIAQIDCSEAKGDPLLPARGLLSFFYDVETWAPGPDDRDAWRVLYLEQDPSALRRRKAPPGPERRSLFGLLKSRPPVRAFRPCGLALERTLMLPREFESGIGMEQDEFERLADLDLEFGGSHRLLGHANPVQNPMEPECIREEDIGRAPAEWRLLLQVDTEETHSDMMWGDCGMLYYWIRLEDLRARRFEKVRLISQCC